MNLEVFADQEWAQRTADRFAESLRTMKRLCLPTGETVTPFFAEVAKRTSLEGVVIFLLDEFGGLPEDDPGRCLAMIRRDLLGRAGGDPEVHAPDVDAPDPAHAAERYRETITDGGIQLAVVGLGANGHIGMNEPGSGSDSVTRVAALDPTTSTNAHRYGVTTTPTWGITVGMSELMAAEEVWVMVTGNHKSDILNRTLHGPIDPEVPATFLTGHPNCTFLADESAGLTGPS